VHKLKKSLLDVVFASEKRKGVLLLLCDRAMEMESLFSALNTTRQALLPQIRILEDHYLVSHHKDTYELTSIGKLIVDEMKPLLSTVDVLDFNTNFWGERDLEFIPPELLGRISELGQYRVNEPCISNIHELNKDFTKKSAISNKMYAATTIFHPNFMELFDLWTSNETEILMVISEELFDKLRTQNHNDFQELLDNPYIKFYLYSKPFNFVYITLNDYCILLTMLKKDGRYDNKELMSYSSTALEWGKELFDHYLKGSTPITGI